MIWSFDRKADNSSAAATAVAISRFWKPYSAEVQSDQNLKFCISSALDRSIILNTQTHRDQKGEKTLKRNWRERFENKERLAVQKWIRLWTHNSVPWWIKQK